MRSPDFTLPGVRLRSQIITVRFDQRANPPNSIRRPFYSESINEEAKKFSFETELKVVVAYDGTPMHDQLGDLERGVDLLVATPGRLVDMVERSWISLEAIKCLVIDEADRMLDMGFEPQIRKIVDMMNMPKNSVRQSMLFSATFPPEIQRLASDFLHNYIFITVGRVGSSTDLIDQKIEFVNDGEKSGFLLERLQKQSVCGSKQPLRFVKTKREADTLWYWLHSKGFPATAIHGGRTRQVWNMRKCRNLLIALCLISLRSTAASARTENESDVCPIKPMHSYFLPRNTCPVVHVSAEHWVHAKRTLPKSSWNSEWNLFHLLSFLSIKDLAFALVLVSSATPLLYILNIQTDITATIFYWETKLIIVWACNLLSSIVYYTCWILFDITQHLKDEEATKSVWLIIYKNFFICMVYILLLCTLGYQHRLTVQRYVYTKQAMRLWFSLIMCSMFWFWLPIIFHSTSLGLVILAWIAMIIMYITKWTTSKSFKWLPFMLKTAGLVSVFILQEDGKYFWYDLAYKVGILCRVFELMLPGYPWAVALKSKVKNLLNR